ncbi:AraC family transcriptional regulator ligand-binding domain-containing protein [Streptomyces sp. SAS_270]|uniref:AraC family transcriptional regulator ligand-binding domain-containing protein n=1 Tax=Streptomyces sp. SAS_270 TaxID=3412748 RepID=UPI00403D400C
MPSGGTSQRSRPAAWCGAGTRDLRSALERCAAFHRLFPGGPAMSLEDSQEHGEARMVFDLAAFDGPDRYLTDSVTVVVHRFAGWLIRRRFAVWPVVGSAAWVNALTLLPERCLLSVLFSGSTRTGGPGNRSGRFGRIFRSTESPCRSVRVRCWYAARRRSMRLR